MAESTCTNNSDHVVSVPTAITAVEGFFTMAPQTEEPSESLRWYRELVISDVYRDAELTPFGIQEAKN